MREVGHMPMRKWCMFTMSLNTSWLDICNLYKIDYFCLDDDGYDDVDENWDKLNNSIFQNWKMLRKTW